MAVSNFTEYLIKKKIDANLFKNSASKLYSDFEILFSQVHENSFTAQKLFLLNNLRKEYPFIGDEILKPASETSIVRPKMKVKPKI